MELVLPSNYVEMQEEEMMYLEGGLISVYKNVFATGVNIAMLAAFTFLGGSVAGAGLKTILASMSMRKTAVSAIVKGAGVAGIKIGNSVQNKILQGLAAASVTNFSNWVFDKYIDNLDGKKDGKYTII